MKACFILALSSVYSAKRPQLLFDGERLLQISTNTLIKVKGHYGLVHPSVNV